MPLLVSVVLLDVVQVIPPNNDRALHLCAHDDARQDAPADRDVAGKRALLVDVGALDGFLGCFEAEADFFVPPLVLGVVRRDGAGALEDGLGVLEDVGLLLERPLDLHPHTRATASG